MSLIDNALNHPKTSAPGISSMLIGVLVFFYPEYSDKIAASIPLIVGGLLTFFAQDPQ